MFSNNYFQSCQLKLKSTPIHPQCLHPLTIQTNTIQIKITNKTSSLAIAVDKLNKKYNSYYMFFFFRIFHHLEFSVIFYLFKSRDTNNNKISKYSCIKQNINIVLNFLTFLLQQYTRYHTFFFLKA